MNPNLPPMPSLQGMQDILLPPPVPFWPATPAWGAIALVVLAALLWLCWRGLRRWRGNAYRRQALRMLEDAAARGELPALVKRAALAAWPRQEVAGLAGAEWANWLRRTAPRAKLTEPEAMALAQLSYLQTPGQEPQEAAPLALSAARRWLARHDRAA